MLDPGFDRIFGRTDTRIAVLEEMPVDGQLASALAALRTMQMDGYAAVRVHALWSKVISWATAQQMIATNDAISGIRGLVGPPDDLNEPYRIAAQEIANATAITYAAARSQVDLVDRIDGCMPESWEALDRGDLSLAHVRAFHRATANCVPKLVQEVERQIVPQAIARRWTPSELARAARKLIISIDPEGAAKREEAAKAEADVEFYPGEDGMGHLNAHGPAAQALQMADAIDDRAEAMARAGDNRPLGVRRFQAMYEAVMGTASSAPLAPVQTHTLVTIGLDTLLGLNNNPGELAGYGPITAETARKMAADSTLSRLVTDPVNGTVLVSFVVAERGRAAACPYRPRVGGAFAERRKGVRPTGARPVAERMLCRRANAAHAA